MVVEVVVMQIDIFNCIYLLFRGNLGKIFTPNLRIKLIEQSFSSTYHLQMNFLILSFFFEKLNFSFSLTYYVQMNFYF